MTAGRLDARGAAVLTIACLLPAFASADDLENALWRAEAAHVEHQKRPGGSDLLDPSSQDETWPAWYASYMVAEQTGSELPA